jgi:hypothetical protein
MGRCKFCHWCSQRTYVFMILNIRIMHFPLMPCFSAAYVTIMTYPRSQVSDNIFFVNYLIPVIVECVFLIRKDTGQHDHGDRSSTSVALSPTIQLHPASSGTLAQRSFTLHSSGSGNAQYQPTQHSILGPALHTQSAMYPSSSPKPQMNELPYSFAYATPSRHNNPPVGGTAVSRDSDPRRMHSDQAYGHPVMKFDSGSSSPATARINHDHTHRRGSSTISSLNSAASSSHYHSPPNVSAGTQPMNALPSESMSSYPTLPLSPSWASRTSPHPDMAALRPSIDIRMQLNSFENVEDSRKRAALYSVNEPSSDIYRSTNNSNASRLPFGTNFGPAMNNERDRWPCSPMKRMRSDGKYGNAPPSPSSQSSASHSTSQSDSSSPSSSFPNGISTSGPSADVSTSAPRKNKMHKCTICGKSFPRPSGLDTHMNSHTGDKRRLTIFGLILPITKIINCSIQVSICGL